MIEIDGSTGSGGGQMLRSSLGLSAITGKPFRIFNIRKGRCSAGIKEQHLQAIKAVAKLCDAEIKGAEKNSLELKFNPKEVKSGNISVNISTAGSVGLVLQALLIPAINTNLGIKIKGGATYGKFALPVDSLEKVLLVLLQKAGYNAKVFIDQEGFFPKGGALVRVESPKAELNKLEIIEKGNIVEIAGLSIASKHLENKEVAKRQAKEAKRIIYNHFKIEPKIDIRYVNALCPGSGIQLWVKTENSIIGGNSLGELKKSSEQVGREAAETLIEEFNNGAVDSFTADQLLPYMALAKGGKIKTSRITNHIKTNIHVIEQFLDVKFKIEDKTISCTTLET